MPRVVHFEINADQPERAVRFYRESFGWDINLWDGPQPYWLAATGPEEQPGINGAIMPRSQGNSTVVTIDVPDIDEALVKILTAGGKAITGKMPITGVGTMAYCVDTESNVFGVMQADPDAPGM